MNVFLYVRVSTEEQSRSGLSLETEETIQQKAGNTDCVLRHCYKKYIIKYIKIQNFFIKSLAICVPICYSIDTS